MTHGRRRHLGVQHIRPLFDQGPQQSPDRGANFAERAKHQPRHTLPTVAVLPEGRSEGPHRASRRVVELLVEPIRAIEEVRVDQPLPSLDRVCVLVERRLRLA